MSHRNGRCWSGQNPGLGGGEGCARPSSQAERRSREGEAAMVAARSPRHPGWVPRRGEREVSGGGRERRRGPRGGERGRRTHPERGVRPLLVVVLAPV